MSQMKNSLIDTKDDDLELTPEEVREIKRRIRDFENPVRYVIYSNLMPQRRWRLFLNVADYTFCDDIYTATLFKTQYMAEALARACSEDRKRDLLVAKITTKGGKRKVLKYEKK
jgi:hypothetical protein